MKDFSDTTMAFPAVKGAFVLVLVILQHSFSEILISHSQLVDCDNMRRDQSLDCENLRKSNATQKLIQKELDILLECYSWSRDETR